ncbi:hypothetical protein D9M72_554380 [compost metagenome]
MQLLHGFRRRVDFLAVLDLLGGQLPRRHVGRPVGLLFNIERRDVRARIELQELDRVVLVGGRLQDADILLVHRRPFLRDHVTEILGVGEDIDHRADEEVTSRDIAGGDHRAGVIGKGGNVGLHRDDRIGSLLQFRRVGGIDLVTVEDQTHRKHLAHVVEQRELQPFRLHRLDQVAPAGHVLAEKFSVVEDADRAEGVR